MRAFAVMLVAVALLAGAWAHGAPSVAPPAGIHAAHAPDAQHGVAPETHAGTACAVAHCGSAVVAANGMAVPHDAGQRIHLTDAPTGAAPARPVEADPG